MANLRVRSEGKAGKKGKAIAAGKPVWSDEFDGPLGSGPSADRWEYCLGNNQGWGNNELESYTVRRENCSILQDPDATGGKALAIRAIQGDDGYTSARLKTEKHFNFQYGSVEARMKLPFGQGIWPAFWMLGSGIEKAGWPDCGEIDVMENIGKASDQATSHGTIHGPGYSGDKGLTCAYRVPGGQLLCDGYHLYAVEWRKDFIQFLFDGAPFCTRTPADLPQGAPWVFNQPFFLLLNLAVGGNWPGYPDETTRFPQTFLVDYIRVYP